MRIGFLLNSSFKFLIFSMMILGSNSSPALADYEYWGGEVPFFPSQRGGSTGQMISLDLDPQNILNGTLRIAAREGRTAEVAVLLKQGADIDQTSDRGETALMLASRYCYPKVVATLLQSHADVNIKSFTGKTALMIAAAGSCAPVVELLVARPGLEIEVQDGAKKTALNYAEDNSLLEVGGPSAKIMNLIQSAKRRSHLAKSDRNKA
jgi:hypothetical protein